MRHHSSSRWALPPTGPVPHRVGVPSAAVKPLSAEPPVASAANLEAETGRRAAIGVEQLAALFVLLERQEIALAQNAGFAAGQFAAAADLAHFAEDLLHDVQGRKAHIDRGGGARRDGVDRGAALDQPDIDRRAEVVIGQPVQALDLAGERLDRADALRMSGARMGGAAGHLQFDKGRTLAPRHEVAGRPAGLGVEDGARVLGLGFDDRARGGRGDLLVGGVEAGQRAGRAEAPQRFEHEGVHDEARFHVGDTRPEGLVAVDAERPLGGGAVGEHGVAMPHQHDRPVAAAVPGIRAAMQSPKISCGKVSQGMPAASSQTPQPIADGIDAALVVAAGIDVHEVGQQVDHRLMLPSEMFDDGGLRLDAHGFAPT